MDRSLLMAFWNCGDDQIIQFAIQRAHLNRKELICVTMMLDECMTQEETAEAMNLSTRKIQSLWCTASEKLLNIPWVRAYGKELKSI